MSSLQSEMGDLSKQQQDLRYKALREAARGGGYAKIAVAHHGDDQAETVLYHFFMGREDSNEANKWGYYPPFFMCQ
ncbi:MAG: ATP-binding protein [Dialister invisus]